VTPIGHSIFRQALSAAGSKAVKASWDKHYREHPEELKAKLAKGKKTPK